MAARRRSATIPAASSPDEREIDTQLDAPALHALEEKLADVRRILAHAARTRTGFKPDVKALASLPAHLLHQVLEAALR